MKQRIQLEEGGQSLTFDVDGDAVTVTGTDRTVRATGIAGAAVLGPGTVWVQIHGHVLEFTVDAQTRDRQSAHALNRLTPPMPATVVTVHVSAGDRVHAGQTLVVVEAMKMELPIRAPHDGVVKAVHCRPGELVQPEQTLVELSS